MPITNRFVEFCRVWSMRLQVFMIALSVLIAISFTESAVAQNPFFALLTNFVGGIVPGIFNMQAVARYPALAGALSSLNWVVCPFVICMFIVGSNFWNSSTIEKFKETGKRFNWFTRRVMAPLVIGTFILGDFNVFPLCGFFRMTYAKEIMQFPQMQTMNNHPIAMALFYSGAIILTNAIYALTIIFASEKFLNFLKRMHIVKQHAPT